MKAVLVVMSLSTFLSSASAMDPQLAVHGRQEEQRSCTPCHSVRLVNSQRLSTAAWEKEINKMIGWGAPVSDRQILLDYLSQQYSVDKPMPRDEFTGDGAHKPRK